MASHYQPAIWRDAGVDGEHVQTSKQACSGNVTRRCSSQLSPKQLAARIASNNCIVGPSRRTKSGPVRHDWHVEIESASALMLRRIIERAGLIEHIWKKYRMPRREAIMAAALDMQQLI